LEASPFIGSSGPKLLPCAVLYLDMLGVSQMAQGSQAAEELRRFDKALRRTSPFPIGGAAAAETAESAYPGAVFSDSILSARPILSRSRAATAQAIFSLILEAAQLQAGLATRDYFARGAITLGKFHFYGNLIFGPALVEAVQLERGVAVNPRIVISAEATLALRRGEGSGDGDAVSYAGAPVLVDSDGVAFVDYLSGSLQADADLQLTTLLTQHRDAADGQLDRNVTDFRRWSKYRWVAEYHNAVCNSYRHQLEPPSERFTELRIDAVHTRRSFEELR
jgi:hypothetical protein